MNSQTHSFKSRFQALLPAIALTLVIAPSTQAGLTDLTSLIPSGQTVVFSDDFNNNDNGWTDVGTTATIGTDPFGSSGESTWSPTSSTGGEAISSVTLGTPVDINAVNSFSIYFRTSIETVHVNSRFSVGVVEAENAANFSWLGIFPVSTSNLNYRDLTGGAPVVSGGTNLITAADEFVNFRMDLTKTGEGSMSLTGYYYNETTTTWDSFVTSGVDARFSTTGANAGLFDEFSVKGRNAGENNRAAFDAFAVTTAIPEPSSLILLGMSFGLLAVFKIKKNRP